MIRVFSESADVVLSQHPQWQSAVSDALLLGQWPAERSPICVEVFDQSGLLSGQIYDHFYTVMLPKNHRSQFQAWCFDGELVCLLVGKEIVIDRLQDLDHPLTQG
ncbi:hypothetical protein IQ268_16805 [Oculatella sp. LEGE 06141]|uniref:hypothetical protein n=1 Tax=Oculatella sp. LEGE 06141 TaxID=1828648 RepID=UPI00188177E7|nr:hypothetical protein [Oculatella sp. LEGE 06141]MBE9180225.1 hypothetical protein [Oculatella sp. LEGE 06141]